MNDPHPPQNYLGFPVPPEIAAAWHRPEGAAWRQARYRATNRLYPPTEHTRMRPPEGMCPKHHATWMHWREHHFDPATGDRWPGVPYNPFHAAGYTKPSILLEQHRTEWDAKNLEQMAAIEALCQSARNCSDLPDILTWSTVGALAWKAEAEGFRYEMYTIDRAVYLDITGPGADGAATDLGRSRHPHVKLARLRALDHWQTEREHLLAGRGTGQERRA